MEESDDAGANRAGGQGPTGASGQRAVHARELVNADVRYLPREGLGHFVLWDEAELIRDNLIELFSADSAGAIHTSAQ